jgi:hypothetical protein
VPSFYSFSLGGIGTFTLKDMYLSMADWLL